MHFHGVLNDVSFSPALHESTMLLDGDATLIIAVIERT
jgi:hypothetical protein